MKIEKVLTKRINVGNYAQPIIYEWEDVIADICQATVTGYHSIYRIANRFNIHNHLLSPSKDTFRFVVNGKDYDEPMNSRHIIPCVIDFFEKGDQLQEFYKKHSRNKVVLLSSPFDYQYLRSNNCPLNIGLFAYSLSDKWKISRTEKKYDIVLTGRQDPLLYSFFKEYIKRHPNVTYVKRGQDLENDTNKTKEYYLNGKECLGAIKTRDEFMQLQASGTVTLYGVQGYFDGFTKGFYHVTPHFLEIIACGCHVLAHYPVGEDGVDAQYYEFDKFSPSIETYEQFEIAMDNALSREVNWEMYSTYLKKHYTSSRVKELEKLIAGL